MSWYIKTIRTVAVLIIVLFTTALVIARLQSRNPEPLAYYSTEVIVETETEYVERIKYVDPYDWEEFTITAYTANDTSQGTDNIVYTGLDIDDLGDLGIAAVDPDIIPLYSIIEVKGKGAFVALDTGGLISGRRIDLLFDDIDEAYRWGVQQRMVWVIE